MIVRRSGRLQSLVKPARGQELGTAVEQINLVDSDVEDERYLDESERQDEPLVEAITTEPIMAAKSLEEAEPIMTGKTLEEKVDQLIEDVEELKSRVSDI